MAHQVIRWLFEKYDGLRGFWNPLQKAFFARTGNKFNLPDMVIESMPHDIFLDGEIWYTYTLFLHFYSLFVGDKQQRFGRESFQEALKVSNRTDFTNIHWDRFKFMVFDAPKVPGTYEERYNYLGMLFIFILFYFILLFYIFLLPSETISRT